MRPSIIEYYVMYIVQLFVKFTYYQLQEVLSSCIFLCLIYPTRLWHLPLPLIQLAPTNRYSHFFKMKTSLFLHIKTIFRT